MLTYGYGNRSFSTETNCSKLKVVLSTKHNNSKFSKYEYVGIEPDFKLNNTTEWIDQVVKIKMSEK
ncbi:MAG: hypothetical protein L0J45_06485 [Psychroflexus sp.]|nr:hypothetical protein [Psychroflexus sp.]MDN6309405.1 hypothetical protein [Psychroflexus sp.]